MQRYLQRGKSWFAQQGWQAFPFQEEAWEAHLHGHSGLVNAPTGSGKTYALFMPILLEALAEEERTGKKTKGLRAIWITPIRALTKDIAKAGQRAANELGLDWKVSIRTGDTSSSERAKQKSKPPQVLITTPESLHLLLSGKGYPDYFGKLSTVVVDEWHELIGSKRGVQVELALSRFKGMLPNFKVWGISATIGNMEEAIEVLLGKASPTKPHRIVRADIEKKLNIHTILPDEIERFPWSGHLGILLLPKLLPILAESKTSLIFTNTRAQCEIWYQNLLEVDPDLAGQMAMHHSSISRDLRDWVENALHEEQLKAVVCTSSLDLGVDFRPVETIIQIGSPKGVARFLQRAGRSGHQPGALSTIYFVPTNSLELIEAAALREAIERKQIESRIPHIRCFDVLVQYLVTLAVSEGFRPDEIFEEVRQTHCFQSITQDEWAWCLHFIVTGGESLEAYDEYRKVIVENGVYKVNSKRIALRHRLSIGTISSDANLNVKYLTGGRIGTIEERFISQLSPGDVFWFAGRSLELVRIKDMMVQVKKSKRKTGKVPTWLGGRISFSSELSEMIRIKMAELATGRVKEPELQKILPLTELQADRSHMPGEDEFLIEYFKSREGYHLVMYPLEGRYVHEGMSALIAYRLAEIQPLSFTIAMSDYGFELLCDQPIPIREALEDGLLATRRLSRDVQASINSIEMAGRRFRDIASISGLIFKGYPGKPKKDRHLQSSSRLFFEVFGDYEPDNLLLQQSYEEVMTFSIQQARLQQALERINQQRIVLTTPAKATPLSFHLLVDRLRERLTSEKLEDRIQKMKLQLVK
ncbi:MAG: ligase-associated DNA damage response DEXH box helicase [Bacteroidota bacterium]